MLEVKDLGKNYEGQPLLRGVSFRVDAGETVCLLGRSGSGKSTILRIISGLEKADRGQVLWDGHDISRIPVHQRGFGLMFQDYALFPHRSVAENVAFGLRMQNLPRAEIDERVRAALARVNMTGFARRRVTDLSGGEQQRVALARAMAPRPRLLMLDEPLGALDRTLREQLMDELRRVLQQSGIPAIYVTHDQEEAFTFADKLIILHEGRVEQAGSPAEVYLHPASVWIAGFFGQTNLLEGQIVQSEPLRVQTAAGLFELAGSSARREKDRRVTLLLRAGGARPVSPAPEVNVVAGTVEDVVFRGEGFRVQLKTSQGQELTFHLDEALQPGQQAVLAVDPDSVVVLD